MSAKVDPAVAAQMARLRRELPHVVAALDAAAARRERSRLRRRLLGLETEMGYHLYGDEYDTGMVPINEVLDVVEDVQPGHRPRARSSKASRP